MNELDANYFYLVYSQNRRLEIRFPSYRSMAFIAVRGVRATRMYEALRTILDMYKMARVVRQERDLVLELPSAVGLSVAVYMLATFNTPRYTRYIFVVEQMSKGELPVSKHLTRFIELAIDISRYIDGDVQKQIVSKKAARITARALRVVLNELMPKGLPRINLTKLPSLEK